MRFGDGDFVVEAQPRPRVGRLESQPKREEAGDGQLAYHLYKFPPEDAGLIVPCEEVERPRERCGRHRALERMPGVKEHPGVEERDGAGVEHDGEPRDCSEARRSGHALGTHFAPHLVCAV